MTRTTRPAGCFEALAAHNTAVRAALAAASAAVDDGDPDRYEAACAALGVVSRAARRVPVPDRVLRAHWRAACDAAARIAACAGHGNSDGAAAAGDQYRAALRAAGIRVDQLTEV